LKLPLPHDYKLPVFPKIIRECLVYLYTPDADIGVLAKTLSQDIGVCAQILKLANSSLFLLGKGSVTTDLKTAINRIGHENLRQIMLLNALENTVYFESFNFLNFKSFCKHASFTSIACTEIAKRVAPNSVSDMQIAGLMHDVGLAILANLFPKHMNKLVTFCNKHSIDFATAEDKLCLEPHRELGERVLKNWDIPENVIKIIGFHDVKNHEKRKDTPENNHLLIDILILSDNLAHSNGYGYKNYKQNSKIDVTLLKRVGMTTEEITSILNLTLELANAANS
jgi:HD-like signal output (HDOD) protein